LSEPESIARETLDLLEWPRLASHLAEFASTDAGRAHCLQLALPDGVAESRRLLEETTELLALDGLIDGGLSFQGCRRHQCHGGPLRQGGLRRR
jgi:DNA mismatch repair protein MutS2